MLLSGTQLYMIVGPYSLVKSLQMKRFYLPVGILFLNKFYLNKIFVIRIFISVNFIKILFIEL